MPQLVGSSGTRTGAAPCTVAGGGGRHGCPLCHALLSKAFQLSPAALLGPCRASADRAPRLAHPPGCAPTDLQKRLLAGLMLGACCRCPLWRSWKSGCGTRMR